MSENSVPLRPFRRKIILHQSTPGDGRA
jgi:hypothetical protein